MSIDCRKVPFFFRGEKDSLRQILSHELSHLYSFRILRPLISLNTGFGIRSDVENLDGFATVKWGGNTHPAWFTEGVAQMGSHFVKVDGHDAIRQMVLGDMVRNDRVLSLEQMARFDGTSRDFELAYNQGFSFLLYLEKAYPEKTIAALCKAIMERGFYGAFSLIYGKELHELYANWKTEIAVQFAKGAEWQSGSRLSSQSNSFDFETSSGGNGQFVIANWGSDYMVSNLYQKKADGTFQKIAEDTGQILKFDAKTNTLWFTKLTYQSGTGTGLHDIYRFNPLDQSTVRVSENSRSIAFDVLDSRLVYARYEGKKTLLVSRSETGNEVTLHTFPAETAVYSVSIADNDRIFLTLGTQGKVRAALLSLGQIEYLWPGAEVLDLVYAGNNRVVLTSSESGKPQIYWSDLKDSTRKWFQMTGVASGARFPSWEVIDGKDALVFSEYEKGSLHLFRLENPFANERPYEPVQSEFVATEETPAAKIPIGNGTIKGSLVGYPYPVTLNYLVDRANDPLGSSDLSSYLQLGLGFGFGNAPRDVEMSVYFSVVDSVLGLGASVPNFTIDTSMDIALGSTANTVSYTFDYYSIYYPSVQTSATYNQHNLLFQTALQVDLGTFFTTRFEIFSVLEDYKGQSYEFLAKNFLTLGLRSTENRDPKYDPAHLGNSYETIGISAGIGYITFPLTDFFSLEYWNAENHALGTLSYDIGARVLAPESTISFEARTGGFWHLGSVAKGRPTPSALIELGGSSFFSGYPAGYVDLEAAAYGSINIKFNAFVNKLKPTEWYQRFNLGLKLVGGWAAYFSTTTRGLNTAWPVSAELSLRGFLYIAPNKESEITLRAAVPLNDFLINDGFDVLELPVQFYVDITI